MKLSVWLRSLTLSWLILFPYVFARCQGNSRLSLSIEPEGIIKVRYGQPFEIFCTDIGFTADDLIFVIKSEQVPSEKVNATTRKLYIEKHEKGIFPYYCKNERTNKICPTRVLVDSPPEDVTDFTCRSQNLDIINCTWSNPQHYSLMNYSIALLNKGISMVLCNDASDRLGYCSWNTSSNPRYKQHVKQFFFSLKTCNVYGCNEQNFTIDHFSIVKPDPPSHLKVLGNGTHSVLLQWSIPNNMVDLLPHGVDHRIEYQIAKIDNTSYFRKVDTSSLPIKSKQYKFLLSDLPYAHMQYEVRIYIRTKEAVKEEFWSDFTSLVFYTASERPNKPPDTVVGAFDQNSFETTRRIYVYWKQLDEYEEAGANLTYKVVANEGAANTITLLADKKKSLSYVVLEDASLGVINVDIWSINDNGPSHNKSHLYIPPNTDTVGLKVSSFTKLAYENGTYKLSWMGLNFIDNYTVFWCEHITTKICAGRMNFTILEPNKTNHVINLPRENRYQFAISANNGVKTSGMVWATCDISQDEIPMYGFPVKLDHGVPGKSFVTLTWTMACPLQEGVITGYIISYCPAKDTSNVCDSSFENSTVNITNPKQMAVNITDLKPFRTYQFWLALNTVCGTKRIENASTEITTLEDTPTSPSNVDLTEVKSNSMVISWDSPPRETGIIDLYVIYNFGKEFNKIDIVTSKDKDLVRKHFKLEGLDGFSNYSWSVASCNSAIRSCSKRTPRNGINVKTRIGPPSKLKSPTIVLDGPDFIKWEKPEKPGGTVDLYQIKIVKDGQPEEIINSTNLSISISECEENAVEEKYYVRAVNFDTTNKEEHERKQNMLLEHVGEWSDPLTVDCKSKDGVSVTFILMAVFVLAACSIVIVYELMKFYKGRIASPCTLNRNRKWYY